MVSDINRSPKFSKSFIADRIFSDVAGDITIVVDGESFLLHKFPLAAWSGKIRKLLTEAKEGPGQSPPRIELAGLPGGPQSFELVAKFCYGTEDFEITATNVAMLLCAAEYLEMFEEIRGDNLLRHTEEYLSDVASRSLEKSLKVLSACEALTATTNASIVGIVDRFVIAVAANDPGAEDLKGLKIKTFERVVRAMAVGGAKHDIIIATLTKYAEATLGGGGIGKSRVVIVETLAELIPSEKGIRSRGTVPLGFLFGLLRAATTSGATASCRLGIERRIAMRLDEASLDDLLVPTFASGGPLFDVDSVRRMLVSFLKRIDDDDGDNVESGQEYGSDGGSGGSSDHHGALLRVGRLVDEYLAEIAPDPHLSLQKFSALIELLPVYSRVIDDGLYRAIDIYLKAHPMMTELESKKLCKLVDCGRLSQEACSHAARNERLPVQMSVKVVYFEQLRLRAALLSEVPPSSSLVGISGEAQSGPASPRDHGSSSTSRDNYASLRRENRELRLEISRMRVRLSELEKEHALIRRRESGGGGAFLTSISKGFGRIRIFGNGGGDKRLKANRNTGNSSKRRFVS